MTEDTLRPTEFPDGVEGQTKGQGKDQGNFEVFFADAGRKPPEREWGPLCFDRGSFSQQTFIFFGRLLSFLLDSVVVSSGIFSAASRPPDSFRSPFWMPTFAFVFFFWLLLYRCRFFIFALIRRIALDILFQLEWTRFDVELQVFGAAHCCIW